MVRYVLNLNLLATKHISFDKVKTKNQPAEYTWHFYSISFHGYYSNFCLKSTSKNIMLVISSPSTPIYYTVQEESFQFPMSSFFCLVYIVQYIIIMMMDSKNEKLTKMQSIERVFWSVPSFEA